MIINQSDLDSFHQFASRAIAQGGQGLSFEDLVAQWYEQQGHAQRERAETIASVQRGVDDAEAGRLREAAEVDATIRAELGFPARRR